MRPSALAHLLARNRTLLASRSQSPRVRAPIKSDPLSVNFLQSIRMKISRRISSAACFIARTPKQMPTTDFSMSLTQ